VTADAVELGAAVVAAPKAGKPLGASPQDGRHAADSFNVGDCTLGRKRNIAGNLQVTHLLARGVQQISRHLL
jgi:hypothetical protein